MIIKWIVGALLKPLTSLGGKYLDNQKDKERLKHGTERVAVDADAAVRKIKLGTLLGQLPLFIAEASCALYIAAIFLDSTWASSFFNPLELPEWFKEHFGVIIVSIFGAPAVKFAAVHWNRR